MAKIGKFEFDASKEDGLRFRFGNGKTHRIGGKANSDDDYDANMYDDDRYDDPDMDRDDYDDRYGEDYTDSDYDEGYDDGGYEDGGYDDEPYDDRGYDDDEAYDNDYDDRYSDRDADDYGDEGEYPSENPVMRYLEERDWPTYALLVLLPPLGVWLLWHRRRFDKPIRYAVSGASILWFIVILVILLSGVFSGSGDTTVSGNITMTTPAPTAEPFATIEPDDPVPSLTDLGDMGDNTGDSMDDDDTEPAPTSLAGNAAPAATALPSANGAVSANSVYMTQTGSYYHNNVNCEELNAGGNSVSTVTTDVAIERGKSPCPVCYPDQKVFYATDTGKYYHSDPTCSNMKDATTITEEAAKTKGKKPCPVCITGALQSLGNVKYITADTPDRSGINVYATVGGKYFHTQANCSGMVNPSVMKLGQALIAGKEPCDKCAKAAGTGVWCTKGGTYYHNRSDCSGMEEAFKISLGEALVMGKKRCKTCWGKSTGGVFTSDVSADPNAQQQTQAKAADGSAYVYATKGGTYFHTLANCSGMEGATRLTINQAMKAGKLACPTCCEGADQKAYITAKGTYYHSDAHCSGMRNAKETTVAQAMADGKKKCPTCWGTGATGSESTVYATKGGKYYHTVQNCSGMKDAQAMTMAQAVKAGKTACPTCAKAAMRKVYSTDGGKYYHSKKDCGGMTGAKERTVQEAIMKGQTACPTCMASASVTVSGTGKFHKGKASGGVASGVKTARFAKGKVALAKLNGVSGSVFSKKAAQAYALKVNGSTNMGKMLSAVNSSLKAGTSGIKVYATASGKYYHVNRRCAGAGASRVAMETAMKYGKTACPKCTSYANRTVYSKTGDKHYHYYKAHAGSGAHSGKLSYALAMGLEACPTCTKYTKAKAGSLGKIGSYKSGTSGIKVYATITGKYYHVSKSCAGGSAAHISLETALNYGKKACPDCSSMAKKKIYAAPGNKYYHASKQHAGSKAYSGTLAAAFAAGLKACPVCVLGSEAKEHSDIKYSASGDTAVYIDINHSQSYYHRTKSCSNAGVKNGTRVMLDFAIRWGFDACPFCNPPTSVSH